MTRKIFIARTSNTVVICTTFTVHITQHSLPSLLLTEVKFLAFQLDDPQLGRLQPGQDLLHLHLPHQSSSELEPSGIAAPLLPGSSHPWCWSARQSSARTPSLSRASPRTAAAGTAVCTVRGLLYYSVDTEQYFIFSSSCSSLSSYSFLMESWISWVLMDWLVRLSTHSRSLSRVRKLQGSKCTIS